MVSVGMICLLGEILIRLLQEAHREFISTGASL